MLFCHACRSRPTSRAGETATTASIATRTTRRRSAFGRCSTARRCSADCARLACACSIGNRWRPRSRPPNALLEARMGPVACRHQR
eukprot:4076874-Pleurochrysis_carterae.AAC.6